MVLTYLSIFFVIQTLIIFIIKEKLKSCDSLKAWVGGCFYKCKDNCNHTPKDGPKRGSAYNSWISLSATCFVIGILRFLCYVI